MSNDVQGIRFGFTGARNLQEADHWKLIQVCKCLLEMEGYKTIVTGACVGVDAFIYKYIHEHDFDHRCWQLVIVPANRYMVDEQVLDIAKDDTMTVMHEMSPNTKFWHRNKYIVDNSQILYAFWNGQEKGGTSMTIKIARKENKPVRIIRLSEPSSKAA